MMPRRPERGITEHADEQTFSEVTRLIAESQEKAIRSVNTVLIDLYWTLGEIISREMASAEWGDAVVPKLTAYIAKTQLGLRALRERISSECVSFTRRTVTTIKSHRWCDEFHGRTTC